MVTAASYGRPGCLRVLRHNAHGRHSAAYQDGRGGNPPLFPSPCTPSAPATARAGGTTAAGGRGGVCRDRGGCSLPRGGERRDDSLDHHRRPWLNYPHHGEGLAGRPVGEPPPAGAVVWATAASRRASFSCESMVARAMDVSSQFMLEIQYAILPYMDGANVVCGSMRGLLSISFQKEIPPTSHLICRLDMRWRRTRLGRGP